MLSLYIAIWYKPKQMKTKQIDEKHDCFVLNLKQLELLQTYEQRYIDPKYIYMKFYLFMIKDFRKINAICFEDFENAKCNNKMKLCELYVSHSRNANSQNLLLFLHVI